MRRLLLGVTAELLDDYLTLRVNHGHLSSFSCLIAHHCHYRSVPDFLALDVLLTHRRGYNVWGSKVRKRYFSDVDGILRMQNEGSISCIEKFKPTEAYEKAISFGADTVIHHLSEKITLEIETIDINEMNEAPMNMDDLLANENIQPKRNIFEEIDFVIKSCRLNKYFEKEVEKLDGIIKLKKEDLAQLCGERLKVIEDLGRQYPEIDQHKSAVHIYNGSLNARFIKITVNTFEDALKDNSDSYPEFLKLKEYTNIYRGLGSILRQRNRRHMDNLAAAFANKKKFKTAHEHKVNFDVHLISLKHEDREKAREEYSKSVDYFKSGKPRSDEFMRNIRDQKETYTRICQEFDIMDNELKDHYAYLQNHEYWWKYADLDLIEKIYYKKQFGLLFKSNQEFNHVEQSVCSDYLERLSQATLVKNDEERNAKREVLKKKIASLLKYIGKKYAKMVTELKTPTPQDFSKLEDKLKSLRRELSVLNVEDNCLVPLEDYQLTVQQIKELTSIRSSLIRDEYCQIRALYRIAKQRTDVIYCNKNRKKFAYMIPENLVKDEWSKQYYQKVEYQHDLDYIKEFEERCKIHELYTGVNPKGVILGRYAGETLEKMDELWEFSNGKTLLYSDIEVLNPKDEEVEKKTRAFEKFLSEKNNYFYDEPFGRDYHYNFRVLVVSMIKYLNLNYQVRSEPLNFRKMADIERDNFFHNKIEGLNESCYRQSYAKALKRETSVVDSKIKAREKEIERMEILKESICSLNATPDEFGSPGPGSKKGYDGIGHGKGSREIERKYWEKSQNKSSRLKLYDEFVKKQHEEAIKLGNKFGILADLDSFKDDTEEIANNICLSTLAVSLVKDERIYVKNSRRKSTLKRVANEKLEKGECTQRDVQKAFSKLSIINKTDTYKKYDFMDHWVTVKLIVACTLLRRKPNKELRDKLGIKKCQAEYIYEKCKKLARGVHSIKSDLD